MYVTSKILNNIIIINAYINNKMLNDRLNKIISMSVITKEELCDE